MSDRDELAAVIYGANYVAEWEPDSGELHQQDAQASADAVLSSDWLARVKREAAADAWDRGHSSCFHVCIPGGCRNPHREQVK
jgi:hypothetical protein